MVVRDMTDQGMRSCDHRDEGHSGHLAGFLPHQAQTVEEEFLVVLAGLLSQVVDRPHCSEVEEPRLVIREAVIEG